MVQQEIEQANELAREGNSQAAIGLLSKLIQQDASNVEAWLALADVVDEPDRTEFCLQKVLALDPGNAIALERLSSRSTGGSLSVGSVGTLESTARPEETNEAPRVSAMASAPEESSSDSEDFQDSAEEPVQQPPINDRYEFAPQKPQEEDSSELQQSLETESEPAFSALEASAQALSDQEELAAESSARSMSSPPGALSEAGAPAEPAFAQPDVGGQALPAQEVEKSSKLGRTDLILIGLTVLAGMVLCALVSAALLT